MKPPNKRKIKVGMLVSYDYQAIKNSLPRLYEYADQITLAVDKDNLTWAGNSFYIEPTFWEWVKNFDSKNKISIYKDSFYVKGLSALLCDTRERIMLGKFMGDGGWHVQVDADEYFVNFKHFVDFLHELDQKKKNVDCVFMQWVVLYKKTSTGYLFINNVNLEGDNITGTAIATTRPQDYVCCRIINNPNKITYPQKIIHDSWSRTEEQLLTKLNNWGHNHDFNVDGYFHYWKAINEKNYKFVRNFDPLTGNFWKELDFVEAQNIDELMQVFNENKNNYLLKMDKQISKLSKFAKLCVPPVVDEFKKWLKHNNNMKMLANLTKNAMNNKIKSGLSSMT
jgi:hypothetical protein